MRAQASEPSFGAHARVRAPIAATNTEDGSASGTALDIDIRGRIARAEVVAEPFYKRPKA